MVLTYLVGGVAAGASDGVLTMLDHEDIFTGCTFEFFPRCHAFQFHSKREWCSLFVEKVFERVDQFINRECNGRERVVLRTWRRRFA